MRFSLPNLPEAHILSDILAAYKRAKEFGNKTGFSMRPTTISVSFFQSFAERHVADIVARAEAFRRPRLEGPKLYSGAGRSRGAVSSARFALFACATPGTSPLPSCRSGRGSPQQPSPANTRDATSSSSARRSLPPISPCCSGAAEVPSWSATRTIASDPKGALEALARDTGLDARPSIASTGRFGSTPKPVTRRRGSASLRAPKPSPASIGSFKRVLTGEEIAMVQQICEPIMSQFGYAPVETPRRRGRFFGLGAVASPGKR